MAVKEERPITMAEVSVLAGDSEKAMEIKSFIKGFGPMNIKKANEMKEALEKLDLIKLKGEHIVKIVDFVPTSASDLNKVVIELSLDQDEVNKILDVTSNFK